MGWPIGCTVVQNLLKGSQYNGKSAIVQSQPSIEGRQNVLLIEENKVVAVKSENMYMNLGSFDMERSNISSILAESWVEGIKRGSNVGTASLADGIRSGANHLPFNMSYESSGLLGYVLNFLKRCEHESLSKILHSVNRNNRVEEEEKVTNPSLWIDILSGADKSESGCGVKIAENVGPLVKCMCNDTERRLFKSNQHWRECIVPFATLIYNMIGTSVNGTDKNKKVLNILLEYEGLLSSMVQWGYWEEELRPDIAKELGVDTCDQMMSIGKCSTGMLIKFLCSDERSAEDVSRLETIGTMPIISKEYDSSCMISYTAELVRQLKGKDRYGGRDVGLLVFLVSSANCVDKEVINEMIDWGMNFTSGHEIREAMNVAIITNLMLLVINNAEMGTGVPSDSRIAFAVRAGLFDMCLHYIDTFEEQTSFGSILAQIESILDVVYTASLNQKTAKAIRHKKSSIAKQFYRLEKKNGGITRHPKFKEILEKLAYILVINGSYCCRCNTPLKKTEVKQCNGCSLMVYCSKSCQREDWLNGGHKLMCSKQFTEENSGQFQGEILPIVVPEDERAAAKLEDLEKNMAMIQQKLILESAEAIRSRASSLGVPLHDCIVSFDLSECPPKVEVKRQTYLDCRSKETTCVFQTYLYNEGKVQKHCMQRKFQIEFSCSA